MNIPKGNIILDVKITALHCCFTIRIWLHQMVVLQIILSETKVTFWWSEFQLCTCLLYEQYNRWKSKKAKAKQICPGQSEIDTHGSWYNTWTTQSFKAWAWKCRIHFISPTLVPRQIWESNFLMYVEKPLLWLLLRNSYKKHMTRPEIHVFIHTWWTQMSIMMNPDEDHQKHNNILKFILDQNAYP